MDLKTARSLEVKAIQASNAMVDKLLGKVGREEGGDSSIEARLDRIEAQLAELAAGILARNKTGGR